METITKSELAKLSPEELKKKAPIAVSFNCEVIGYFLKELPEDSEVKPLEMDTMCPRCRLTFLAKPPEKNDFMSIQQKIVGGK